jgi:hypothetical protein
MNDELKTMWKEAVRSHLRYYPSIFREGLNKTTKNIIQDSRYLGQGLDPGPPEYEAGVLTTTKFGYTEAQCFVLYNLFAPLHGCKTWSLTQIDCFIDSLFI